MVTAAGVVVFFVGLSLLLCLPSIVLLGIDYFLYQTFDLRVCALALLLLLTSIVFIGLMLL